MNQRRSTPRWLTAIAALAMVTMGLTTPAAAARPTPAIDDGLALTPPMGFNNWNTTHCRADFNEAMVHAIADIFVAKGLKDAGYQYVNIDDCWALPERNAEGNLVPHPVRFPNGIKAVADYVHSKGLKFGIYTSAGTKTCDTLGFPGGLDHETQDANLFASWGVDYLKYDNCNNQGVDAKQRYRKMRDALKATGRPIVFSLCEWGENKPWEWASDTGHLWRTTGDISDNWGSMMSIMKRNLALHQYAGPGQWNDPDMLEVGNGGMTDTEYRSHFSLWAIMAAPLLIGSDLRSASQATLDILTNSDVIAVDQDRQGVQGKEVKASGGLHVIVKPLANGDKAVALFNENWYSATVSTNLVEVGLGAGAYRVKDLWSKAASTTSGTISASVPAHGTVLYRLSRVNAPTAPPAGESTLSDLTEVRGTNGWGPFEHNRSNGEQGASDGATLRLQGVNYAKGLGTHAFGEVEYHLGGRCSRVTASVGVDDEAGDRGSVVFRVFADGAMVADSGTMTGASATKALTASVTGATTLRLVVTDAGDGIDYDHADWADAKVTCA